MSDSTKPHAPTEAPAPGRRERRKQALRQHIFDVSVRLFTANGFDATTVEQIAEAADIAPATFFNHFPNKQVVLIEMTNMVVTHLQSLLDDAFERDTDSRTRLIGFARDAAEDIGQARGIARDVVLTMVRSETAGGEPPYLVRVHQPVEELIREGQERGEVREDQSPGFLAEMVVGMLNATVSGWLASPDYPIEKRLCEAAEFAWHAIEAPGNGDAKARAKAAPSSKAKATSQSTAAAPKSTSEPARSKNSKKKK